jgi:hypothetical protein
MNELDSNNELKDEYVARETGRSTSNSIFPRLTNIECDVAGVTFVSGRGRVQNVEGGTVISCTSALDELIEQVAANCDSDDLESYHIDLS